MGIGQAPQDKDCVSCTFVFLVIFELTCNRWLCNLSHIAV
jgi:hypothetical protein